LTKYGLITHLTQQAKPNYTKGQAQQYKRLGSINERKLKTSRPLSIATKPIPHFLRDDFYFDPGKKTIFLYKKKTTNLNNIKRFR
jgi:hypothetical protein